MTQSREYPDLQFVEPRWWAAGRDGYSVQYLVVHYTAGAERSTSAEDGAAYDARRSDKVSTHYFVDSNSVVQCIETPDRASAAFQYGNRMGIHYELCGTQQTLAQWLDDASRATIENAARQMARDCAKYGLPARWLTPSEMKAGAKGIGGHDTVTLAYGLGDHMDPGAAFPRDLLIERVKYYLNGPAVEAESSTRDEDDMLLFFAPSPDGTGPRWAVMTGERWIEYDAQDEGTWSAVQSDKSYSELSNNAYRRMRQPFARAGLVLDGTGPLEA